MATKKGARMRTAGDVVKRLLWDPALPEDGFTVGYLDRFVGILEEDFYGDADLVWTDVPEHRIQWFRYRGVVVWDKSARLDLVFGSAKGGGRTLPGVVHQIDAFLDGGGSAEDWAPDVPATGAAQDARAATAAKTPRAPAAPAAPAAASRPPPSDAGSALAAAAGTDETSLMPPASAGLSRARSSSDPGRAAPQAARRGVPPGATHAILAPLDLPLVAARMGASSGVLAVPLLWLTSATDDDEAAAAALLPALARRAGALAPPALPLTVLLRPSTGLDGGRRGVDVAPHAGATALAAACAEAAARAGLDVTPTTSLIARPLGDGHVTVGASDVPAFAVPFLERPGSRPGASAAVASLHLTRLAGP